MIDETYIEFVPDVDELSAIPLTELFDNVIISVSYTHLRAHET